MSPETVPLLLLAVLFAARCAYYRRQPHWKWLLPGACVALALLPETAPTALAVAVSLIGLGAAIAHIRWVNGSGEGRRRPCSVT